MIMNAYSLIELFQIPKADIYYLLAQSSLQTPDWSNGHSRNGDQLKLFADIIRLYDIMKTYGCPGSVANGNFDH